MINLELLKQVLESKQSNANSHPPHSEKNLCDDCLFKRKIWDSELLNYIVECIYNHMIYEVSVNNEDPRNFILESIILGMKLGIEYKEAEELEKTIK